jgi:chemotaxis regulatin CheY-phosphate phosphatase CheZ
MNAQWQNIEELSEERERCAGELTASIHRAIACVAKRDMEGVDRCTGEQEQLYERMKALQEALQAVQAAHLSREAAKQLRLAAVTYVKVLRRSQQWLHISLNTWRRLNGDNYSADWSTRSQRC